MRTLSIFLLFVLASFSGQAQLNPVSWKIDINQLSGDNYELTFKANIDKGWTVYSQFTSDGGPVPTQINYDSDGFEKIGPAAESGKKKEGFDKIFKIDVIKFLADEPYVIKQKIKVAPGTESIVGYLTYMTCDAKSCLPPTDIDFDLAIPGAKATSAKTTTPTPTSKSSEIEEPKKPAANLNSQANNVVKKIEEAETATVQKTKVTAGTIASKAKEVKNQIAEKVNRTKENASAKLETVVEKKAEKKKSVLDTSGKIPKNPVKWSFQLNETGEGEYELKYIADIHNDWNVYSQFTGEDGPIPTSFNYEVVEDVEMIGDAKEEGHRKEGPDPLFAGVNVIKFLGDEDYIATQKIKANKNSKLKGYLTYMACDATQCLAPTDVDFEVDFANNYFGVLRENDVIIAPPTVKSTKSESSLTLNADGLVDQRIPSITASVADPIKNCGGDEEAGSDLPRSFILGFLGGLLALLTPCVFPMIPLTVSYFTKDNKRSGLMNGLIYGASIMVIYVSMGLLITAFFGEDALNQLSTDAIANTIFFLIFLFFAFSFFGYYEITLPSSWTTKTDSVADKGGILGIFFMAFTLALVSFSCTGPIIGSALVSSATSKLGPAVVMTGFSLALALPFGLFAAFPSWLNSLPRSGGWMTSVKVILGFLELAFAFKFLSVADLTSHWNFLKYELFLGIWVLLAIGMALYLFGKIRFPHDSPIKKLSPVRMTLAIACTALAVYLATGFRVNPNNPSSYMPKALTSGIAPPANYTFFLPKPAALADKDIKAKYPSYTICANNIPCFKDYNEGLNFAKEADRPVFLDFTGHGCVNCRKTEEFIWVDPEVKRKLSEEYVLISLYADDREKLEETLMSIRTLPDGANYKIRNVGNRWTDFQISNFAKVAQPLYVLMSNDEQVVSNTRGYEEGTDEYNAYLDCGLLTIASLK